MLPYFVVILILYNERTSHIEGYRILLNIFVNGKPYPNIQDIIIFLKSALIQHYYYFFNFQINLCNTGLTFSLESISSLQISNLAFTSQSIKVIFFPKIFFPTSLHSSISLSKYFCLSYKSTCNGNYISKNRSKNISLLGFKWSNFLHLN